MGDLNKVNLNLQQKKTVAEKEKLLKNNLQNNVIGNAFAVFIEQAIAKVEQKTQNESQSFPKDNPQQVVAKKEDNSKTTAIDNDYKIKSPEAKRNKIPAKKVAENSEIKSEKIDLENLKQAFNLAGRKLEQFFYVGADGKLELKKVEAVGRIDKTRSISIDDFLSEMIQSIKKAKVGNLNKLSVTLKPENLGEMEIFFTILEENQVKKVFISFAGNEDALNLLRNQQQQLANQLNGSGHFLGGLDFFLYGGKDHQRERGDNLEKELNFSDDLLKSPDKQAIISTIDSYVSDLIVNYIT